MRLQKQPEEGVVGLVHLKMDSLEFGTGAEHMDMVHRSSTGHTPGFTPENIPLDLSKNSEELCNTAIMIVLHKLKMYSI